MTPVGMMRSRAISVPGYPARAVVGSVIVTTQAVPVGLGPGGTYQSRVYVLAVAQPPNAEGAELTDRTVTYVSSNAAVFTVNSTGLVSYVGVGTASLTAVCEGVTSSGQNIVCASPAATVDTVTVTPSSLAGQVGGTGVLSAVVRDAGSAFLAGRVVTWASSDTNKATVSADSGDDNHMVTVTYVATGGSPTITATCETVNSSAVGVTVTSTAPAGNFRTYTTPEMAYMLGPQTVPGVYTRPGMVNLEAVQQSRVDEMVTRFVTTPAPLWSAGAGTISPNNGSSALVGSGTAFASLGNGRGIRWVDVTTSEGTVYALKVSHSNNTNCVVGGYDTNFGDNQATGIVGANQSGIAYELSTTASIAGIAVNPEWWSAYNYYDPIRSILAAAAKWGSGAAFDATLLGKFRQAIDAGSTYAANGAFVINCQAGFKESPRSSSLLGVICRALDGKSHWWTNIRKYIKTQRAIWVDRYAVGGAFHGQFHWSVRDMGYMVRFNAVAGAVDPDGTERTAFLNKAIAYCLDPLITMQGAYGQWENTTSTQDSEYVTQGAAGPVATAAQPFLNAIGPLWAEVDTIRAMIKAGRTGGADAANFTAIKNSFLLGCDYLILCYLSAANGFHANFRHMPYWTGEVGQYRNGSRALVTVNTGDATFAVDPTSVAKGSAQTWSAIMDGRQLNADNVALFAFAYMLSGLSKYKTQWLEMLASCLEFQGSNPSVFSSEWYAGQTLKNLGQHIGAGCIDKGAAWTLLGDLGQQETF